MFLILPYRHGGGRMEFGISVDQRASASISVLLLMGTQMNADWK